MDFVDRVVFGASTLVSAALMPESMPRRAFVQALRRAEICVSPATLSELETVLGRSKFDRYLDRPTRDEFLALYRRHARLYEVDETHERALKIACRDPRDNKSLALALSCSAIAMISSDQDLLTLTPYEGISIVTARLFLDR